MKYLGLPGTNGTITFRSSDSALTVNLEELFEKGVNNVLARDGIPSVIAFAKNGTPLADESGKGYVKSVALKPFLKTDPAEYTVDNYEATVKSTNSSGTESSVVYIGFKVNDLVKAAKLEGTAGKLTATADDGYAVEIENGANENNMLAISKDGKQFKSSPWFVSWIDRLDADSVAGATVSSSNMQSMLKSLFEYHVNKYYKQ